MDHQDLEGIFSLFAEGAEYEGTSKTLRGRIAIREMYEQSFDKGTAAHLEARLAKLLDGAWAVALYKVGNRWLSKSFVLRTVSSPGTVLYKIPPR